jgi:hypothetical protein
MGTTPIRSERPTGLEGKVGQQPVVAATFCCARSPRVGRRRPFSPETVTYQGGFCRVLHSTGLLRPIDGDLNGAALNDLA